MLVETVAVSSDTADKTEDCYDEAGDEDADPDQLRRWLGNGQAVVVAAAPAAATTK